MKNTTFSKVESLFSFLIRNRKAVVLLVAVLTVLMAFLATKIEVKTIFSDLLPKNHPYVKVNQKYKSTFGGSNLVTIMVEVDKGDIFNEKVLSPVPPLPVVLPPVPFLSPFPLLSLSSPTLTSFLSST